MKASKFSLHRISAAVLSVMASAPLLALEANPTDKVHGRQITVTGTPVIERGTGPQVRVRTLPTAHDEDSTDTHTGWRYVWQVARTNVESEAVSTNPGVVPAFSARSQDYDKAVRVCLKAVASSGYPVATQTSEQVCSGEVVLTDSPPTASKVTIVGTTDVGNTLTGSYTYADAEGDAEGGTTFQWYRFDNAAGTSNKVAISGATGKAYRLQNGDLNKYLAFEVTPKAVTGKLVQGVAVSSAVSAQVLENLIIRYEKYNGLSLNWYDASNYCSSRGGRLPHSTDLIALHARYPYGALVTMGYAGHQWSYWARDAYAGGVPLGYAVNLTHGGVSTYNPTSPYNGVTCIF